MTSSTAPFSRKIMTVVIGAGTVPVALVGLVVGSAIGLRMGAPISPLSSLLLAILGGFVGAGAHLVLHALILVGLGKLMESPASRTVRSDIESPSTGEWAMAFGILGWQTAASFVVLFVWAALW